MRFLIRLPAAGLLLTVITLTAAESSSANDRGELSRQYISSALQGDLSNASALFSNLSPGAGNALDAELAARFEQRFVTRIESPAVDSGDEFIDRLVLAYRQYWIRSLMGEWTVDEGEEWLSASLEGLLDGLPRPPSEAGDVFQRTGSEIERRGFHHINGKTLPYFDLMLWKSEDTREYDIELTDGNQPVTVVFMDDFFSMGWSYFATFGAASTGGWAAGDALYCVAWTYDTDSENFRVSYLKHEGRHFADYARYPALQQADLEYRAKLTELAFAATSLRRLLRDFTANGAANPESPHAFANYRVVRDVYRALYDRPMPEHLDPWSIAAPHKVNPVARELLERHTEELDSAGAPTVRSVLQPVTAP